MSEQYVVANANRCTVHPQHVMVNQGRDEQLFADLYLCACGERAIGNTDEAKVRPTEEWRPPPRLARRPGVDPAWEVGA